LTDLGRSAKVGQIEATFSNLSSSLSSSSSPPSPHRRCLSQTTSKPVVEASLQTLELLARAYRSILTCSNGPHLRDHADAFTGWGPDTAPHASRYIYASHSDVLNDSYHLRLLVLGAALVTWSEGEWVPTARGSLRVLHYSCTSPAWRRRTLDAHILLPDHRLLLLNTLADIVWSLSWDHPARSKFGVPWPSLNTSPTATTYSPLFIRCYARQH